MTLKERLFDAVFDNAYEFKKENVIPQCEQIADEYAMGFAEWITRAELPLKELLEIYKKTL